MRGKLTHGRLPLSLGKGLHQALCQLPCVSQRGLLIFDTWHLQLPIFQML